MAMAYEFYYDIDRAFAETCINAAEKAWGYLNENPNLIFEDPSDITTGDYGDSSDKDERYWAAAQLYRATGNDVYLEYIMQNGVKTGQDWTTVGNYGSFAILTMKDIDKNSEIYTRVKNYVISQADLFLKTTTSTQYGVAITKFNWGSNMTVANAGVLLGVAYDLTNDSKYLDAAESNLNYLWAKSKRSMLCYRLWNGISAESASQTVDGCRTSNERNACRRSQFSQRGQRRKGLPFKQSRCKVLYRSFRKLFHQ